MHHRVRRPLIALLVLVLALVVGYVVQARDHGDSHPRHRPSSPGTTVRRSGA